MMLDRACIQHAPFGWKAYTLHEPGIWFKIQHLCVIKLNFTVSVGGHMSKVYHLDYGVPQGSIIGLMAFTMYSQPVANIIRKYDIQFHIICRRHSINIVCLF